MKKERIMFDQLINNYEDFVGLADKQMTNPFYTVAFTIYALNMYPKNKEESLKMLTYLCGPRGLSEMDKQFIRDRFMDKDYVPRSYFEGALPSNDYTPSIPYTIMVHDSPYSYQNEGYMTLFVQSGGADSLRQVQVRQAKDGKWYLWEQMLLADIRKPESENPWV